MKRILTLKMMREFEEYLRSNEKRNTTIEKYTRDINKFYLYADGREINKKLTMEYKASLVKSLAVSSANSMLAALNRFLQFMEWGDCCVKQYRIQKEVYSYL